MFKNTSLCHSFYEVKYKNRITENAFSERVPGFDCVDKNEINLRQNTVVPLKRQSMQTQVIISLNLGVLPATFDSKGS